MSCLFPLQRRVFQRDADKHIGIATMFSGVLLVPSYSYSQSSCLVCWGFLIL